jgi:hypothetical protein
MNTQKTGGRRLFFSLVTIVLCLVLCETATFLISSALTGTFGFREIAQLERERIAEGVDDPRLVKTNRVNPDRAGAWRQRQEIIHPYLGYVQERRPDGPGRSRRGYRRLGFPESAEPASGPSPDRFVIGLFGGSVAENFASAGKPVLEEELNRRGVLRGRELVVHNLGFGGYKQPQQLFALNYLLALGAHFDAVINLDGYNEVALPPIHNVSKGVSIIYPRDWYYRVQTVIDPDLQLIQGKIAFLRQSRREWADLFSRSALRFSAIGNLVWRVKDRRLSWSVFEQQTNLQSYAPTDRSFAVTGPAAEYVDERAMYRDLAELWRRSSLQMHRLCLGNSIPYFHFLQPNQYVPGSKTIGAEERAVAIRDPARSFATIGYAELRERGQALRHDGVSFHDLTMVFVEVQEPVYRDSCCHLNQLGNTLLAVEIASAFDVPAS